MKRFQKISLFPLLFLVLFYPFIFVSSVSAQAPPAATPIPIPTGTWYRPSLQQFREKVVMAPEDELFAERYVFAQINWIIHSLTILFEIDISSDTFLNAIKANLSQNTSTDKLTAYASLGPSGLLMFSMADMLGNRPASGIDSIRSTLAKFSLATPVYAQTGYGYNNLTAIGGLWAAARNTSYLVIAILLIVAGFMVILRQKINAQTMVSVQLIIPRLVTSLLLVTFSYAIAGLIIDAVYLIVALVISAFATTGVVGHLSQTLTWFGEPGFYKMFITFILYWMLYTVNPANLIDLFPSILGLIMVVIVFFLLLRVWWMMMKSYITLMLLIIAGPWIIMLGVLPNSKQGFSSWLRNIMAQASVFVVVPVMFMIALVFMFGGSGPNSGFNIFSLQSIFQAIFFWIQQNIPFGPGSFNGSGNFNATSNLPSFPIFSSPSNQFFTFLVSFAILALMPKIADMVRDALKAPKFPYGSAFGEALGPVSIITAPIGQAANIVVEPSLKGLGDRVSNKIGLGSSTTSNKQATDSMD